MQDVRSTTPPAAGRGEPPPGQDPGYTVIRLLGGSAKALAYLAQDPGSKVLFTLRKILTVGIDQEGLDRLVDDTLTVGSIGQENLPHFLWARRSADREVLLASEYIAGTSLRKFLRAQGRLTWERAKPILHAIAEALGAAHDHGISHRDLRPENVFVIEGQGRVPRVKVIDFGLSPIIEGPSYFTSYLAPEQLDGRAADRAPTCSPSAACCTRC
jgi:serine/threonine-protein kinase